MTDAEVVRMFAYVDALMAHRFLPPLLQVVEVKGYAPRAGVPQFNLVIYRNAAAS